MDVENLCQKKKRNLECLLSVCLNLTLFRVIQERPEFLDQACLVLQPCVEMSDLGAQGFIHLLHVPLPT